MVDRFSEANLQRINNKSSFMGGIIRRIKEEGGSTDLLGALDAMPRRVRDKLDALRAEGRLKAGDLESRVTSALKARAALRLLPRLPASPLVAPGSPLPAGSRRRSCRRSSRWRRSSGMPALSSKASGPRRAS